MTQPSNLNFLSPLGFRFLVQKLPNVNYFCQTVSVPSVSISATDVPNPVAVIPYPSGRLSFEPLIVRFRVDEDLKNYIEILNWLIGLGHPVSLEQTRQLSQNAAIPPLRVGAASSYVSDATLVVLTSHKNPNVRVTFRDIFPISLTELTFDSTDTDVTYLEASATFRYLRYDIESL